MEKVCMGCGKPIDLRYSFCLNCGAPVAGGAGGVQQVPVQSGSLQDLVAMQATQQPSVSFADIEVDSESDKAATVVWGVSEGGMLAEGGLAGDGLAGGGLAGGMANPVDPFAAEVPFDDVPQGNVEPSRPATIISDPSVEPLSIPMTQVEFSPAPEEDFEPDSISFFDDAPAPEFDFAAGAIDDGRAENPTIINRPLIDMEDEEEESPTIVLSHERYLLTRDEDGDRVELSLPCVIGRGREADRRLKGSLAVSRKHARLFAEDGLVMIQDADSTNGTFVNGVRLDGDEVRPLSDGDAILLGSDGYTFTIES